MRNFYTDTNLSKNSKIDSLKTRIYVIFVIARREATKQKRI
ncbi:hypothetical protein HFN_0515 [Helicobacter fennelliae MRY12-0050]|uniref:Uncharacterized protein n=1 Tax=Helicobacter fennelliae MRY12-0050 TaxID=1325130 RepID=T1CRI7_9HELI|nr:hypothetical protein HFN_0515 [Helicobacter fennelliae MRY12-0050]